MSSLKSEYQQQFIGDADGTGKENYRNMLQFRNKQKANEFRHTPIIWLDSNGNINDVPVSETVSLNTARDISMDAEEIDSSVLKVVETSPVHRSRSVQVETTVETVDVAVQSPSRRSIRKGKSGTRRSTRNKTLLAHEKPIIAYGWADKSSIQKKRTFNVKAPSTDVRCSALRAAKQRESQKHVRLDKKERLQAEKLKKQVLIDSLTNFDQWQTEYQKEFCK